MDIFARRGSRTALCRFARSGTPIEQTLHGLVAFLFGHQGRESTSAGRNSVRANQLSGLRGATHQKAQSGYRGRSSALRSEKRSERGYPKQRSLPSSGAPCRGVVWAIDSHQKTYPEMRYRFDHVLRRTLGGRQWPNWCPASAVVRQN
jgi:hypothetical protein